MTRDFDEWMKRKGARAAGRRNSDEILEFVEDGIRRPPPREKSEEERLRDTRWQARRPSTEEFRVHAERVLSRFQGEDGAGKRPTKRRFGTQGVVKFMELWNKGPFMFDMGPRVPPEDAHAMSWYHHILRLAHCRPLPKHVRKNPMILAEPFSRETGWPLEKCLEIVKMLFRKTAEQIREELGDGDEGL